MSLYLYAVEKGDVDAYFPLYAAGNKTLPKETKNQTDTSYWLDLANATRFIVVTEQADTDLVNLIFVDTPGEADILGTMQMKKEDGIWKVFDISME